MTTHAHLTYYSLAESNENRSLTVLLPSSHTPRSLGLSLTDLPSDLAARASSPSSAITLAELPPSYAQKAIQRYDTGLS